MGTALPLATQINEKVTVNAGPLPFGIYASAVQAEQAVGNLTQAGFPDIDISVLVPDQQGTSAFAFEKDTKAPEGAKAP
jgi:hypothetical protein